MKTATPFSETLRGAFEHPTRGVVGLVDDLLALCRGRALQLDWHADLCRVRYLESGSEEAIEVPLRLSVFRAILARVAALCNEQHSGSVSPYSGRGDLSVESDPPAIIRVAFVNTADEQKLELLGTADVARPAPASTTL